MKNLTPSYFAEKFNATISGAIEELVEKRGTTFSELTAKYNEFTGFAYKEGQLEGLLREGVLTSRQIAALFALLGAKPLLTYSPATSADLEQAERWSQS